MAGGIRPAGGAGFGGARYGNASEAGTVACCTPAAFQPWPDARRGLQQLKKSYVIGTLSNGNIGLLVDMAKHGGLPWDVVFSAEVFRHYKPDPETYLGAADLLGIAQDELMLVAAHKDDLFAAKACGLRTAFVRRPIEYGPAKRADLKAESGFDYNVGDFIQLADRLAGRTREKK